MEHRHYHRRKLDLAAQLNDTLGTSYECQVSDVGHGGVCIIVKDGALPAGNMVDVNIPYSNQLGSGKRKFTASVVHRNGSKMGLVWVKGCRLDGLVKNFCH